MATEKNPMTAEQAADLAALEAAAATAGPEPGSPEAMQIQQQGSAEKIAGELAALVLAFVAMAKPILPSLSEIYTPDATQVAAHAVAGICVKHGWLGDGLMGEWGEEIAAAVVLVPMGVATYQGIRGDLEKRKPKQPDLIAPGAKTVTAGYAPTESAVTAPSGKSVQVGAPVPA